MMFLGSAIKHNLKVTTEHMKMLLIIPNTKLFPEVTRSILQLRAFPSLTDGAIKNSNSHISLVKKSLPY